LTIFVVSACVMKTPHEFVYLKNKKSGYFHEYRNLCFSANVVFLYQC
jgi:hypothetical protein